MADRLRRATFQALERIVDFCLAERVDFLLLAGDLFDAGDRSIRARLHLHQQLCRLDAAGIPTFIVHGNHDPLSKDAGNLGLPGSVKVFGPDWEEVPLRRNGQLLCRIQGISYAEEAVSENLARRFRRNGPEFTIGLLHANLGGHKQHRNYAPCTAADLASADLSYWALGHVHTRAEIPLPSGGVAVYPGNPQGRHALELGERGFVLAAVEGARCQTSFHPADSVRWHRRELDIASAATLAELLGQAVGTLLEISGDRSRSHAVQLVLGGRGELHRQLCEPEAIDQLTEHLRKTLSDKQAWVFLSEVVDRTAPAIDLDALQSREGLMRALVEASAEARTDIGGASLWEDEPLEKLMLAFRQVGLDWPAAKSALQQRAANQVIDLVAESPP